MRSWAPRRCALALALALWTAGQAMGQAMGQATDQGAEPGAPRDALAPPENLVTPDSLAVPEAGNQLTLSAGDAFSDDDNLYRLPDGIGNLTTLIGRRAARQDHLDTASAGLDAQWTRSGQALGVDARVDENRYAQNTDLDNTSGHAKVVWDWRSGTQWLGEIGADFTQALAGSANSKYFEKDMVDQAEYFGNATLQVDSRWNLTASLRHADHTHSALPRQFEDFHSTTEIAGIQYVSLQQNSFGAEYRHVTGNFTQPLPLDGVNFNQDYREDAARVLAAWQLGGSTRIDASAGYLVRSYPRADRGGYSGAVWRASLQWQAAPKTTLVLNGWRELNAYLDAESDYYVSSGASLVPTWNATERIALLATLSWTDQNYANTNPDLIATVARHDRLSTQQFAVAYTPREWLRVQLGYGNQQRSSNQPQFQYSDRLLSATFSLSL
jgi:hypothetical protein